MLVVRGGSSKIVWALAEQLDGILTCPRHLNVPTLAYDHYLFCQGLLTGERITEQSKAQITEAFYVNTAMTICDCDKILAINKDARICVIGSESGYSWSYDSAYAASKAGLHKYVETKRLPFEGQQLVCVAPGIIEDTGMTLARDDQAALNARRLLHPKRRFVTPKEVARLIHFLLYEDQGFITNVVIRMTGGEHVR